ncbi:MAG: ABC transporter ATP-binding protein [Pseudomonadales bacterium]|nr:ABC transporter ATP-binding protein [Pseudomonadales bacterium]HJN53433.1 ABC transporter ATP-binding protein [Pseudomonadales bacterium]|tara:strand:- start:10607 stop:11362 length:756 start_codon:yes stop_codon:yes gene_type:complete
MNSPLIQTKHLDKSYSSDSTQVQVLSKVELDIQEGEFVVLMGSSGSGKSTLLYLLSGLERISSGEIVFADQRIDTMDETALSLLRRTGIGFIFQAINMVPHLTLFENIVTPGYLVERNRRAVDEKANRLLESMGILDLADRLPAEVSGGEQQRSAIARAMINSPRALFADEPTGALNFAAGTTVLESFCKLNAAGQTILMATHEVRAACYGDRIIYMRDGQIQAQYQMSQENKDPKTREPALLNWLSGQGW